MAEEHLDHRVQLQAVASPPEPATTPERQLFAALLSDISSGTAILPSPQPAIALRIHRGIRAARHGRRIARLLAADPAISAKALRAACAAGQLRRPRSLPAVVERLGRHYTTGLVARAAELETLASLHNPLLALARDSWQRALRVSTISYLLATLDGRFDPEEATLAGLLHNMGELALLGRAAREPAVEQHGSLHGALQLYGADAGRELARNWGLPAGLARVAGSLGDWYRVHDGPADMVDLVLVAQRHASLGEPQAGRLPGITGMPAFGRLELGNTGPRFSLRLLDAANNALSLTERQLDRL